VAVTGDDVRRVGPFFPLCAVPCGLCFSRSRCPWEISSPACRTVISASFPSCVRRIFADVLLVEGSVLVPRHRPSNFFSGLSFLLCCEHLVRIKFFAIDLDLDALVASSLTSWRMIGWVVNRRTCLSGRLLNSPPRVGIWSFSMKPLFPRLPRGLGRRCFIPLNHQLTFPTD